MTTFARFRIAFNVNSSDVGARLATRLAKCGENELDGPGRATANCSGEFRFGVIEQPVPGFLACLLEILVCLDSFVDRLLRLP